MPHAFYPRRKNYAPSFNTLYKPARNTMTTMTPLESRGGRPLQMSFDEHLGALIFFHLEEHTSAQHLLQVLEEDNFARSQIAPKDGIKKSSFSEATNSRGINQFMHVFKALQEQTWSYGSDPCGLDNLSAACYLLLQTVSGKGFYQAGAATAHSDSE